MEGVALYSYRRLSAANKEDGRGVRAGNEIAKHFAGNNVDVIIYAVEKSLDSYKFNLLHCKQTFISQLKSGALGARTIDEGAMDEKSGMNFSEYMALLSGNTDLLDKAKLEKKIASLEGERKSWGKGKRDSEFKLEAKTGELRNNTAVINAMTEDWNRFLSVVKTDKEGNRLNAVKEDGVSSSDEKVIGKRLQEIAKNATTGGLYNPVGELYGFPIKVVSERMLKEGLEFTDNRFVVEGNYKYTYNNVHERRPAGLLHPLRPRSRPCRHGRHLLPEPPFRPLRTSKAHGLAPASAAHHPSSGHPAAATHSYPSNRKTVILCAEP